MNKLGIAWFDEPSSPTSGWACFDDSKVERFDSPGRLRSNYIWVTNLTFFDFKENGFSGSPNLRPSEYFRSSLQKIFDDLHIIPDSPPTSFLPTLLTVLGSVVNYGDSHFDASLPPYRYHKGLSYTLVPRAIKKQPKGSKGESTPFLASIFESATQHNQGITGSKIPAGSQSVRFHFPKSIYFKWLLSQAVPATNIWKESKLSSPLILGTNGLTNVPTHQQSFKKLKSLLATDKVGFCEICVHNCDSGMSSFYTFGHEGLQRKAPREWASIHEVLEISQFSTVEVTRIFVTEAAPLPFSDLLSDSGDHIPSLGYFRENMYKAVCDYEQYGTTAVAAYLSSYDRIACGRAATAFNNDGFKVASFGNGYVSLYLRGVQNGSKDELNDAFSLALPLGLHPTGTVSFAKDSQAKLPGDLDYHPFDGQVKSLSTLLETSVLTEQFKTREAGAIGDILLELENASQLSTAQQRRSAVKNILQG